MGYITYVPDGEVCIYDMEGLKKYLDFASKDDAKKSWVNALRIEDNYLNFTGWDGSKILGYWYQDFCELLNELAVFLGAGIFDLEYETPELHGTLEFGGGYCEVSCGHMEYDEMNVRDMRSLRDMPDFVKEVVIARNI